MSDPTQTAWIRPEHWTAVDLPEDNGDPSLLDAVWALSEVQYRPPGLDRDISYFGGDYPDDCPRDHREGKEGETTLVAFVRLAKAVLAVADRMTDPTKTTVRPGPEGDIWRVDVEGYACHVKGEHAKDHIEQVNRKLARMKLALHKLKWREDEAGAVARMGLGL